MRILYFGTSPFAIPALRALVEHGDQVVAVVTQPDRPAGRGGKLAAPPVKEAALAYELPVLQPLSCRAPEFLETAQALAPDLTVVAAYGQFLPDALLATPRLGSVNLHGSLLPKYRGAAPIQRAIWNGEAETGVCLMWMVREMDAGDVIACARTPITPEDTAGSLTERLAGMAAGLLLEYLPALERREAPRTPQDSALVTLAPPIRKEERIIDWTRSAEEIWRQVRALSPTPSAVTTFRDIPVKILEACPASEKFVAPEGEPGEVVESSPKVGIFIATGMGYLQILTLQLAGKRPLSAVEFLRGYRIAAGECFV